MRVTVAVPAALKDHANHAHVLLGKAKALNTYTEPNYEDGQGNQYCVSSGLWREAQIAGVTDPAVLQAIAAAGDVPEIVDLTMAGTAQAVFVLDVPDPADEEYTPLTVNPAQILGVVSDNPKQALVDMGLTRIVAEE